MVCAPVVAICVLPCHSCNSPVELLFPVRVALNLMMCPVLKLGSVTEESPSSAVPGNLLESM